MQPDSAWVGDRAVGRAATPKSGGRLSISLDRDADTLKRISVIMYSILARRCGMAPRPRKVHAKGGEPGMVRTTLELPEALWRAAKMRAIDEGDLRTVMLRALEEYLARPSKARKAGT
jgi:hypothetical protein